MKNRFLALITPVILLIGAIVFIGLGILNLQQVKKFPEIQATVTKVEQELDTAGDSSDVNETVWVHYTVDERDYDEVLQFHEVAVLSDYPESAQKLQTFVLLCSHVACHIITERQPLAVLKQSAKQFAFSVKSAYQFVK